MNGMELVMLIGGMVCACAPMLLAATNSRSGAVFLAIVLAAAAGALLLLQKGIGDTVLISALWIGAMICGLAAFMERVITRNSRNATFRLLHNNAEGLHKPFADD